MIIVQDVFVVRREVPDKNYTEHVEGSTEQRQMTPDEMVAYEYDATVDDALEMIDTGDENSVDADDIHWSRKVTHVDG